MYTSLIADLDELVLKVRNPLSRVYISEAISAYRVNALRTALVAAWIAVVQDIIGKLRELAAGDDANAAKRIKELDTAISGRDIPQFQKIESNLLGIAERDFELLASHERIELERLKDDRNLCAHPAFVTEEQLFQPTPEQVRAHIVHAIIHLLQYQPVQGKSALKRIIADIVGPAFPTDQDTVYTFLHGKYLKCARPVLIRNLIIVLLKALIRDDDPSLPYSSYGQRILHSLVAIDRSDPQQYDAVMKDKLSASIGGHLGNDIIPRLLKLLSVDRQSWGRLDVAMRTQLAAWVSSYTFPQTGVAEIFDIWGIPDLRQGLETALTKLEPEEQERVIKANLRAELADRAINLYACAFSFRQAEHVAHAIILPIAQDFSSEQVIKTIEAAMANQQIYDAIRSPSLLARLFDETQDHYSQTQQAWARFKAFIVEKGKEDEYDELLAKL